MVKQSFPAQSGKCQSLINFKHGQSNLPIPSFPSSRPPTSPFLTYPNMSSFRTICGPNSCSRQISRLAKSCEFSWVWIHLICVLRPNVWTSNAFRLNTRKLQRYDYKQKDVFPWFAYGQVKLQFCAHKSLVFEKVTPSRVWSRHRLISMNSCEFHLQNVFGGLYSEIACNASYKPICFDLFGIPSLWGNSIDLQHFDSEIRDHSSPSSSPVGHSKLRQKCIWFSSKCRAFSVRTPRKFWYLNLNFDKIPVKLFPEAVDLWQSTFTTSLVSLRQLPCSLLSELQAFVAKQKRSASCLLCEIVKRQEDISWYLKVEWLGFFSHQPCQHVRWPSVITLLQSAAILSVTVPQLRFSFILKIWVKDGERLFVGDIGVLASSFSDFCLSLCDLRLPLEVRPSQSHRSDFELEHDFNDRQLRMYACMHVCWRDTCVQWQDSKLSGRTLKNRSSDLHSKELRVS